MSDPATSIKPGYKTTEFWLTLLLNIVAGALAYLEQLDATWAVVSVSILNSIYVLIRGAVKNGAARSGALSLLIAAGLCFLLLPGCGRLAIAEGGIREPATGVILVPREGGGAKAIIDQQTVRDSWSLISWLLRDRDQTPPVIDVVAVPTTGGK